MRAEFQPSCIGAAVRAQGAGSLKLELKSADERVLWWATQDLAPGDDWQELTFNWEPADLRRVKSLYWAAEPGAQLRLDSISLSIQMPKLPFEQEIFLLSYAKLARLYSQNDGTVRERALQPAGRRDSVAAGGLFCLATCVACKMGLVKLAQAEQILHKVQAAMSDLQRAKGLLPPLHPERRRQVPYPRGFGVRHFRHQPLLSQPAARSPTAMGWEDAGRCHQGSQRDRLPPSA